MNFQQWLVSTGKAPKTYHQALLSRWVQAAGLIKYPSSKVQSLSELDTLTDNIRQLDTFKQYNTDGKGMYSAALKQYAAYLDDMAGLTVSNDIEQIITDAVVPNTEKTTLINTRMGQGKFRKKLIDHWGGCAVTQYPNVRFLVASHIKPWKDSNHQERLDHHNGLLLLPNLDKVFDLGYITFAESGTIQLSKYVDDYQTLGIQPAMTIPLSDYHQHYMAHHRNEVFKH